MSSFADLTPGMIGFGPLAGGWGKLAMWGEVLVDGGFHVGDLNVGHVFVVTDYVMPKVPQPGFPDGRGERFNVVEAMPNGARFMQCGMDRWTPEYAYVRLPEDYPGQGADAAIIARAMIGTPYSFASYAALAAWRFGWKTPKLEAWIDRRGGQHNISGAGGPVGLSVALPCEAICSVLADQAWALTGKQVMPAGTPHQCVTPSGLGAALLTMPGAEWIWPR